jgi:hypothetical protein
MNSVKDGGATILQPPCARLAAVCAATEGREVTCPASMQRSCATLATLRRMTASAEAPSGE